MRRFSTLPARFRSLSLPSGLSAMAPTSTTSTPALLCVPSAFGSVTRDFQAQLSNDALNDAFSLFGVDLRAPERDLGSRWLERDADDVLRAADALELPQFSLLGSSHGANVSAVVAAKHPDRVSRLVLVNGNAFVSDEDLEELEEHEDVTSWPQDMREAGETRYGVDNLQDKWSEMLEALRRVEREDGGDLYCGQLPYIKCKTLVVAGSQNKFLPAFHGEYLSERIMHSRLEVDAEGGHDLVSAERFNTLLTTFLQEPDDKLTQSREYVAVPSKD